MDEIKSRTHSLASLLSSNDCRLIEMDPDLIDFSKLCRTCLKETTDNDLGNESLCVISDGGKLLRVYDMFEGATGLKIKSNDMLPHHLCTECLKLVNSSYIFRSQSQRADQILRNILDKVKQETEDQPEDIQLIVDDFQEEDEPGEDVEVQEDITEEDECEDIEQEEVIEPIKKSDLIEQLTVEEEEIDWMNVEMLEVEHFEELDEITSEEGEKYLPSETDDANPKSIVDANGFSCEFCSKEFSLQRDIIQHYKDKHPKEKPFKCSECLASFSHIQSMRRHKKTHQERLKEKMCPICSRMFHRSDDLKRHIRTHTHERPYSCTKCLKAFKQHTELKDHMLSHDNSKKYKCSPCGKEWRSRNGWYLHMKLHQEGNTVKEKRRRTKKKFTREEVVIEDAGSGELDSLNIVDSLVSPSQLVAVSE